MKPRHCLLLVALPLLVACGDTSSEAVVADSDTGMADTGASGGGADVGVGDDAAVDASGEGDAQEGGATCPGSAPLDTTLTLLPTTYTTQIHAAAAFDGEAVWVVFNAADTESGLFKVYATRIGCDGSPWVPPFRVDSAPDWNKTDPSLVVNDGRVLIAWQSDSSCCSDQVNNLDINYRLYDLDGAPLTDEARLEPTRGGAPEPGNAWQPVPVAMPEGRFAIVGTLGVQEANRFQTFAQRLDRDGSPMGDAIDAALAPDLTQIYPAAAAAADGTLHMAWTREEDSGDQFVITSTLAPGAASASAPQLVRDSSAASPAVAALPGLTAPVIAMSALTTRGIDVAVKTPAGEETRVGVGGRNETTPALAVGSEGQLGMAWYRNIRGIQNEVFVGRVDVDSAGAVSVRGEAMIETDTPAGFYTLGLTHVGEDTFFVVWSEGVSPDYVIKARFVALP